MQLMMYKKKSAKIYNIIFSDKSEMCVGENNRGMHGIMPKRVYYLNWHHDKLAVSYVSWCAGYMLMLYRYWSIMSS